MPPDGGDEHVKSCTLSAEQLLSDPVNCGRCDHDCLGGGCVGGQCQPRMLVNEFGAAAIVVQGDALYAASKGGYYGSGLAAVDLKTGAVTNKSVFSDRRFLWADQAGTYVAQYGASESDGDPGKIVLWPADGSAERTLVERVGAPMRAVTSGTTLFVVWLKMRAKTSGDGFFEDGTEILAIPKGGGVAKSLGEQVQKIYPSFGGLTVSNGYLYWSEGRSVYRVAQNGGSVETVMTESDKPTIAGFDSSGFWYAVDRTQSSVSILHYDVTKAKAVPAIEGINAEHTPYDDRWSEVVVDDDNIYYLEPTFGLRRVALKGSSVPVTIAAYPANDLDSLAQDARALYWVVGEKNGYNSSLVMLAK